jgi:FixJ family two-component response regulator
MSIEDDGSDAPLSEHHTNGELFETVSARDLISTLSIRLKPPERTMLHSLADGCVLREIATKLNVSYPTALKYRRNIATLTTRWGSIRRANASRERRLVSQTRQE